MTTITPIKPSDAVAGDWRDKASGGYDMRSLEKLVKDAEDQPDKWRLRSDLCHAYYDGKQLTADQEAMVDAEGLKPRSTNLIGRVINSVLGQEARNRSDIRIETDTEELGDVVDVLNVAMKEAQRESYADMAVSTGYAGQVKGGIGWVEVSRDSDPLNYPYRVRDVPRWEMSWDWRSRDFLLRDARWQCRSQWHDLDELEAAQPKFKGIFQMLANNWEGFSEGLIQHDQDLVQDEMSRAFDDFRRFKVRQDQWLDSRRKRVRLYEVWYKVPAYAIVLRMGPTRTIVYDPTNPLHQQVVARGLVKVEKVLTRQVRKAIFAGCYRLTDEGTTRRNFPYVPFFAFRDDQDGSPYGLIEGMIAPQDEYNERRLRIQWLLRARQILVDNDSLDPKYNNYEDLADEAQRPDMVLVRNAARRNANGVEILSNFTLQKEQVEVMQDAKNLIQDVSGVYPVQMGQAQSGVTAGVAIAGLVEQGIVAMGELNDNYRNSRRMVFENLMDLIVEDHSAANMRVMIGQASSRRAVMLNSFDPQGMPINQVKDAPIRMGMSDVPNSPAARQAQQTQISEIIKSLGNMPQAVAVLVPPFLESSALDTETRRQAAEDFRKVMGLPPGGDKMARAEADKQAAEMAQAGKDMQIKQQQAQLDELQAKVAKLLAATELDVAKTEEIRAGVAQQDQDINDALAEADGPAVSKKQNA